MRPNQQLHSPFRGGDCRTCHLPHDGGKAGLGSEGADVCLTCHVGTRKTYARAASIHPPFADGPCTDCHDPHGSAQPKLLRQPHRSLCLDCHGDLKEALEKKGATVHAPTREGCLTCHHGHGAGAERLLRKEIPALCADCHQFRNGGLSASHGGFAIDQARCTGCHDPHATASRKLLLPQLHPPFEEKTCEACHRAPAARPKAAELKAAGIGPCADCHDFAELAAAKGAHQPVKRGACFDCHSPHAASGAHLLSRTGATLCAGCHQPNAPAQASGHKGVKVTSTCVECHPPHAPRASKKK
jgi:predicted CXXCH cytochrome family protein